MYISDEIEGERGSQGFLVLLQDTYERKASKHKKIFDILMSVVA